MQSSSNVAPLSFSQSTDIVILHEHQRDALNVLSLMIGHAAALGLAESSIAQQLRQFASSGAVDADAASDALVLAERLLSQFGVSTVETPSGTVNLTPASSISVPVVSAIAWAPTATASHAGVFEIDSNTRHDNEAEQHESQTMQQLRATINAARQVVANATMRVAEPSKGQTPASEASFRIVAAEQQPSACSTGAAGNAAARANGSQRHQQTGRWDNSAVHAAVLSDSLTGSQYTDNAGWAFPWVCLTRQDEQRLVDLIMLFKAVATSSPSEPSAAHGVRPSDQERDPASATLSSSDLTSIVPGCSSQCAPFNLFNDLYALDYPPEVFLSCPHLLSHIIAPLGQPDSNPQSNGDQSAAAPPATFAAAVTALALLFERLQAAVRTYQEQASDKAACSSDVGADAASGEAAATAISLARQESRIAVRDYAAGLKDTVPAYSSTDGTQLLHGSGTMRASARWRRRTWPAHTNDATTASSTMADGTMRRTLTHSDYDNPGAASTQSQTAAASDSRYSALRALLSTRRGTAASDAGAAADGQQQQHEQAPNGLALDRYYSMRYRYPPIPFVPASNTAAESSSISTQYQQLLGLASISSQPGPGSIIDAPVPVARFAGLVLDACLTASKYQSRLPMLVPLMDVALRMAFDPFLISGDVDGIVTQTRRTDAAPSSPTAAADRGWTGEAAACAQGCIDAACETVTVITERLRRAADGNHDGSSTGHSAGSGSRNSSMHEHAVLSCAQLLSTTASTPDAASITALLSVLRSLVVALPVECCKPDDDTSRQGLGSDGLYPDGASAVATPGLSHAARVRIRRVALARASSQVAIPTDLLCFMAGAACTTLWPRGSTASINVPGGASSSNGTGDDANGNTEAPTDANGNTEALDSRWEHLLSRISPAIASSLQTGRVVAGDVEILTTKALSAAARAAAQVPFSEPGSIQVAAPARAFEAFCACFIPASTVIRAPSSTSYVESTPSPIDAAQRVSRAVTYLVSSSSSHQSSTADSGNTPAQVANKATKTLDKICGLVAAAAASPLHVDEAHDDASQLLLRLLLLHPSPEIRRRAYDACSNVVVAAKNEASSQRQPAVSAVQVQLDQQLLALAALLGAQGERALLLSATCGAIDASIDVRKAALRLISQSAVACTSQAGPWSVTCTPSERPRRFHVDLPAALAQLIADAVAVSGDAMSGQDRKTCSAWLRGSLSSADNTDTADAEAEADVNDAAEVAVEVSVDLQMMDPNDTTHSAMPPRTAAPAVQPPPQQQQDGGDNLLDASFSSSSILHLPRIARALFSPSQRQRELASAALVRLVTEAKIDALAERSLRLSSHVDNPEIIAALVQRTRGLAASVVQSLSSQVPSHLLTDPVPALTAAYENGTRLPLHPVTHLGPVAHPPGPVACDTQPAVLHGLLQASLQTARTTRFETAVAFAGTQLPQLELMLQSMDMPLSVRTSTAEQLSHTLLHAAPIPSHVSERMVDTLMIALQCVRDVSDSVSGFDASGNTGSSGGGAVREAGTAMMRFTEDRSRFTAALAVLLDSLTASSPHCRSYIRDNASASMLVCELLYHGPAIPVHMMSDEMMVAMARTRARYGSGGSATSSEPSQVGSVASAQLAPHENVVDSRLCAARIIARCTFEAFTWTGVEHLPIRSASGATGDRASRGQTSSAASRGKPAGVPSDPATSLPGAETHIDAVSWCSRPLLQQPAIAGGPSMMVPCLSIDVRVQSLHTDAQPDTLSMYVVTSSMHNASGKNSATTSAEAAAASIVAALGNASSHAAFIEAAKAATALIRADGGIAAALLACDQDSDETQTLLRAMSRFLSVAPTCDDDQWLLTSAVQLLTAFLQQAVSSASTPTALAHTGVVASITRLLTDRLLPLLELTPLEQQGGNAVTAVHLTDYAGEQSTTAQFESASSAFGVTAAAANATLGATGALRTSGRFGPSVPSMPAPGDTLAGATSRSGAGFNGSSAVATAASATGRAELLVDSLRHSAYDDVAEGYVFDPHSSEVSAVTAATMRMSATVSGIESAASAAAASTMMMTQSQPVPSAATIFDVISFTPSRVSLLAAILELSAVVISAPPLTSSDAASSPPAIQLLSEGLLLQRSLALLHHPHATTPLRSACISTLAALCCAEHDRDQQMQTIGTGIDTSVPQPSGSTILGYLCGVPTDAIPELQPPTLSSPASQHAIAIHGVIAALVRVCAAHSAMDSFQHKTIVRSSADVLSAIAGYARGVLRPTAPAYADCVLLPSVWQDRSTHSFAWLSRLAIDREADVRVHAYEITAALISSPIILNSGTSSSVTGSGTATGVAHSSLNIHDVMSTCVRHATGTVIAAVSEERGFLNTTIVTSSSHVDEADSEVAQVRAACAGVIEAFASAIAQQAAQTLGSMRAGTPAAVTHRSAAAADGEPGSLLMRLDFGGRARIALSSLSKQTGKISETNSGRSRGAAYISHAAALLSGICAVGLNDAAMLHSVLGDGKARDGVLACCAIAAVDGGTVASKSANATSSCRAASFRLLRLYLQLETPACMPLRLRRYHVQPALAHAVQALAAPRVIGNPAHSGCQVEAALLMSTVLDAWTDSQSPSNADLHSGGGGASSTGHPLMELLAVLPGSEGSFDAAYSSSTAAASSPSPPSPGGGSPIRAVSTTTTVYPGKRSGGGTGTGSYASNLKKLATALTSTIGDLSLPLLLRASCAQAAGSIARSMSVIIAASPTSAAFSSTAAKPSSSSSASASAQLLASDPLGFGLSSTDPSAARTTSGASRSIAAELSRSIVMLLLTLTATQPQVTAAGRDACVGAQVRGKAAADAAGNSGLTSTVDNEDGASSTTSFAYIPNQHPTISANGYNHNGGDGHADEAGLAASLTRAPGGTAFSVALSSVTGHHADDDGDDDGEGGGDRASVGSLPSTIGGVCEFLHQAAAAAASAPRPQAGRAVGQRTTAASVAASVTASVLPPIPEHPPAAPSDGSRMAARRGGGSGSGVLQRLASPSVQRRNPFGRTGTSAASSAGPAATVANSSLPGVVITRASGTSTEQQSAACATTAPPADRSTLRGVNDSAAVTSVSYGTETLRLRRLGLHPAFLTSVGAATSENSNLVDLTRVARSSTGSEIASSAYAAALQTAATLRSMLSSSAAALLECSAPLWHQGTATRSALQSSIGAAASDELGSECNGPTLLHKLLLQLQSACNTCVVNEGGMATNSISSAQSQLGVHAAAGETCSILRVIAAAMLPRSESGVQNQQQQSGTVGRGSTLRHGLGVLGSTTGNSRPAAPAAAVELKFGSALARMLTAAAAVSRCASYASNGGSISASGTRDKRAISGLVSLSSPESASSPAESLRRSALSVVAATIDVAINYAGCGDECATDLASHAPAPSGYQYESNRVQRAFYSGAATASKAGSFLDKVISEAAATGAVVISGRVVPSAANTAAATPASDGGGEAANASMTRGDLNSTRLKMKATGSNTAAAGLGASSRTAAEVHGKASAGVLASLLAASSTSSSSGGGAGSNAIAASIVQLHDSLFTCLMAAARRSAVCRQLIISRALPTSVSQDMYHRVIGAESTIGPMSSLPLAAIAAQLRLLAALATPGDSEACGAVMRTPRLPELVIMVLQLRVPASSAAASSSAVASLENSLSAARVAAATLLSNAAWRKGNEDAWLSRPALIEASLGCCTDAVVGVRAAGAAAVWQLCKNTVRIRGALRQAGGVQVLTRARAQTDMLVFRLKTGSNNTYTQDGDDDGAEGHGGAEVSEAAALLTEAGRRIAETLQMLEA